MKNSFCTFFFSILSVFALNHVTVAFKGTDLDLVAKLSVLKPLPKVHYFWPLAHENLTDESRLYELARITHTMCIGTWYTREGVDRELTADVAELYGDGHSAEKIASIMSKHKSDMD